VTSVEKEIEDQRTELEIVFDFMRSRRWDLNTLKNTDLVYFVGCGSSYYIALSASRYFTLKTGIETKALPGGEVVFGTESNVGKHLKKSAVLISRSGESTEVVLAGKLFKKLGIPTLGVSLTQDSSLVKLVDESIVLPLEEKSIVMTKSFTSMLLSLQIVSDILAGSDNEKIYQDLLQMVESVIDTSRKLIESKKLHEKAHYVFLGVGTYEGVARESALKLEEMSLTKTEAYSTFEYRHGPKSLVEDGVMAVIFESGDPEEEKLKRELEGYGGKVVMRKILGKPEDTFLQVIFSQILALKVAEGKGINPEKPRNLTKVVRLDEKQGA